VPGAPAVRSMVKVGRGGHGCGLARREVEYGVNALSMVY
jgi:hypothetical protein